MQLDKVKGTIVDFNELEHVLDDVDEYWTRGRSNSARRNDDPHEVDELVSASSARQMVLDEAALSPPRSGARLFERAELHPNRIEFHTNAEIRRLQGVGENAQGTKSGRSSFRAPRTRRLLTRHELKKIVIVLAGVRTPFAKVGTDLAGLGAADLGRAVVQALVIRIRSRSGVARRGDSRLCGPTAGCVEFGSSGGFAFRHSQTSNT